MRKLLLIILLLIPFLVQSQIGGRVREVKNQKKLKIHIRKSGWCYRKWEPNRLKVVESEKKLFYRHRTNNQKEKEKIQKKINKRRYRLLMCNRNSFTKRKYMR